MEKNEPLKPKPATKGQRIARMIGGVSGMRDRLNELKQIALDISARCQMIRDENAIVDTLTASQLDAILKASGAFKAIFDEIDAMEATIYAVEKTMKGET